MRKKTIVILSSILLVVVVVVLIGISMLKSITEELEHVSRIEIPPVDLNTIDDGTYIGSYETTVIHVKVEVIITNHHIVSITILEHQSGQGQPAEVIIDDVIDQQTLSVDLISGATYSSKVILLAIADALQSS